MMLSELAKKRIETLQYEKQEGEELELQESHASESSVLTGNGTTFVAEQKLSTVKIELTLHSSDAPFVMNTQLNVMWLVLLGLSFATRLWQLTTPKYIVFDEVHFGKFTNFFLQNKFFFDIHPPLGKLLFAITAYLSGYDGGFSFDEIGQGLGEYERFVWILRSVPALLGSLIAPCIYEIILDLGCSHWTASFGALLVIFGAVWMEDAKYEDLHFCSN